MNRLPLALRVLHWVVIANFVLEIGYASYMVFFVIVPEGVSGPLGKAALTMPHDMMVTRRLYAIETWIAVAGLAIYLALTEYLPRLLERQTAAGSNSSPDPA